MVDVLLVVVKKVVLFFGESVRFKVDGKEMVRRRIDVWRDFGLFAFVHGSGEVEGVGVALLLSVEK